MISCDPPRVLYGGRGLHSVRLEMPDQLLFESIYALGLGGWMWDRDEPDPVLVRWAARPARVLGLRRRRDLLRDPSRSRATRARRPGEPRPAARRSGHPGAAHRERSPRLTQASPTGQGSSGRPPSPGFPAPHSASATSTAAPRTGERGAFTCVEIARSIATLRTPRSWRRATTRARC